MKLNCGLVILCASLPASCYWSASRFCRDCRCCNRCKRRSSSNTSIIHLFTQNLFLFLISGDKDIFNVCISMTLDAGLRWILKKTSIETNVLIKECSAIFKASKFLFWSYCFNKKGNLLKGFAFLTKQTRIFATINRNESSCVGALCHEQMPFCIFFLKNYFYAYLFRRIFSIFYNFHF